MQCFADFQRVRAPTKKTVSLNASETVTKRDSRRDGFLTNPDLQGGNGDGMMEEQAERMMTSEETRDRDIVENKTLRVAMDGVLQQMKDSPRKSRNRSLAITHLEDSIMRLGMDMKELNTPNPYPNSYNPTNAIVEPTADGLKL